MRAADVTCPHCGNVEAPGAYCSKCGKRPNAIVMVAGNRGGKTKRAAEAETAIDVYTREAWMGRAVDAMRPWFAEHGLTVPPVRVSIGWPGGRGSRANSLGQCWDPTVVGDKVPAIFVSPVQGDPVEVLETIGHELIHAAGHMHHRAPFQKVARTMGYMNGGKTKSSRAESPDLYARLDALAADLGPFGHSPITPSRDGEAKVDPLTGLPLNPNTQSTRMLKVACPVDGYTVRTTRKWLAVGQPMCPDGHAMEGE